MHLHYQVTTALLAPAPPPEDEIVSSSLQPRSRGGGCYPAYSASSCTTYSIVLYCWVWSFERTECFVVRHISPKIDRNWSGPIGRTAEPSYCVCIARFDPVLMKAMPTPTPLFVDVELISRVQIVISCRQYIEFDILGIQFVIIQSKEVILWGVFGIARFFFGIYETALVRRTVKKKMVLKAPC